MKIEIERKFAVRPGWLPPEPGEEIIQGYLTDSGELTVRVRLRGERAFLTLKGVAHGISRNEFEYEIPPPDACEMLATLAGTRIVAKRRHLVEVFGHTWEVDVFSGANAGLVVAEIELESENESFVKPDWATTELSDDFRYSNRYLASHPYSSWGKPSDSE